MRADSSGRRRATDGGGRRRSEEHTSELQSRLQLVCRLLLEKKKVKQRFLPPAPEALEGIDHFVLGSDRIADDIAGQRALRAWLQRGGHLWVLLNWVEPRTVMALLGDELFFLVEAPTTQIYTLSLHDALPI